MTEMNLVEICHRITHVERALTCTKEFSIKFNGHLKLITSLVNSLYEEEESLVLFEQKIEKRVDHYHKRVFFKKERNGEERVILGDDNDSKNWGYRGEYDGFENPDKRGLVGTWNGEGIRRNAYTTQRGTDGVSVEDMGLNKKKMEIRSEYGNKYRKDMNDLAEGKRGALVNDFGFATVDSMEEPNQRTSEEIAMSRKLDMFMKESDLLKEVIKNGESNAKHLKECLFKLIDAFKDQKVNGGSKEQRIEKVEKIVREEANTREVEVIRGIRNTGWILTYIITYPGRRERSTRIGDMMT